MIALSFIYVIFMSHLSYILLEQKEDFYKDKNFWLLLLGLGLSVYITIVMLKGGF
jgi:hypothetical protein